MLREPFCEECGGSELSPVSRRNFVQGVGAAALLAHVPRIASAAGEAKSAPAETLVQKLHRSLKPEQREVICFDWDHTDRRGLLRTHVSNNWHITRPKVAGDFFTADQQEMIEAIFFGLYNPEWHDRIRKQLQDDAGGYGRSQNIAIFGEPGTGKFQFVMTGRHLTIRCDGDSAEHMAFGGPIFYGHAARGFNEKADHPGNVFWPQAVKANALYQMLDGKQRKQALIPKAPRESAVHFAGEDGELFGLPVTELSGDQKAHLGDVLATLLEPYRQSDREEAVQCLEKQGGLDECAIAFFESGDIGNDGVWDVWRLEGPSFVWHFRGSPHVHVWVNVASSPDVEITTAG